MSKPALLGQASLHRLQAFLHEAIPGHPISESHAAASALSQSLDWQALDASFAMLTQQAPANGASFQQLLHNLERQLEDLVTRAGLPSKEAGVSAFVAHEIGRMAREGMSPWCCLSFALKLLAAMLWAEGRWRASVIRVATALISTWAHHQRDIAAQNSVRDFFLNLAQRLKMNGSSPAQSWGPYEAGPDTPLQWAEAAMSCSYLLASQLTRALPAHDPARKMVWDSLVPAAFRLMGLARCCSDVPSARDWQQLVGPALQLASLQRQLLEGLGLNGVEADALQPLDKDEVVQGLVALLARLSLWFHPCADGNVRAQVGSLEVNKEELVKLLSERIVESGLELKALALAVSEKKREFEGCREAQAMRRAAGTEGELQAAAEEIAQVEQKLAETETKLAAMEGQLESISASGGQPGEAPGGTVPREQVGRALLQVAGTLCSLLRCGSQGAAFLEAGGVSVCVEHIRAYGDWLGGASVPVAGDDPAHAVLMEVANCLVAVLRAGNLQEDAAQDFKHFNGMTTVLDALDAQPSPKVLLQEAQMGRQLALSAKRVLLRLIEAVLVGRDSAKGDFLELNGFESVWACTLLGLSKEDEDRLLATSPGLVRGLVGNALAAISGYAACNFTDEYDLSDSRVQELIPKLEEVTVLEDLVGLLRWQPAGHDEVQAALDMDQADCILPLHTSVLRLVSFWSRETSGEILDTLAENTDLLQPFLGALSLPEAHFLLNERAIATSLGVLDAVIKRQPECVPWILDQGALPAVLNLLCRRFYSVSEEEVKLQTSHRLASSAFTPPQTRKDLVQKAEELYNLLVAPHVSIFTGACSLLAHLLHDTYEGNAACAALLRERQIEPLVRQLRKTHFTDKRLQDWAQYVLSLVKTAKLMVEQQSKTDMERMEAKAAKTAAKLLAEEQREKQTAAAKSAKRQRQKEKAREREEQQREAQRREREARAAAAAEAQRLENKARAAAAAAAAAQQQQQKEQQQQQKKKKGKSKKAADSAAAAVEEPSSSQAAAPGTPSRPESTPGSSEQARPQLPAAAALIPTLLPGFSGGEAGLPALPQPGSAWPPACLLTPPASPAPLPATAACRPTSSNPIDEQDSEFQELLSHLLPGVDLLGGGASSSAPQQAAPASPTSQASSYAAVEEEEEGGAAEALEVAISGSCSLALLATLRCPLSGELMRDPVVAADGVSYQRAAIQGWLAAGKLHSPASGQLLAHTGVRANHALRQLLESMVD